MTTEWQDDGEEGMEMRGRDICGVLSPMFFSSIFPSTLTEHLCPDQTLTSLTAIPPKRKPPFFLADQHQIDRFLEHR